MIIKIDKSNVIMLIGFLLLFVFMSLASLKL